MAYSHQDKRSGELIRAADWNEMSREIARLGQDKADRAGDTIRGPLKVTGQFSLQDGPAVTALSNDATLAGNREGALPTEQAVRGFVSAQATALTSQINGVSSEVTSLSAQLANSITELKTKLAMTGVIVPTVGNAEDKGIMFPKNPAGGSGDAAWMRYYPRSGEAMTLEIGISNDALDQINLVASGGVQVSGALSVTQSANAPALKVTAPTNGPKAAIAEFRHDNQTQGVGIGYASVFATGNNADQSLSIFSRGGSPLLLNPDGAANVAIGMEATNHRLGIKSAAMQLGLIRGSENRSGGKSLFLELYQEDQASPQVPETYPCIRFHHGHRFWKRIEGRPDGFHFKEGDLNGDNYVPIAAQSMRFGDGTTQSTATRVQGGVVDLGVINPNGPVVYNRVRISYGGFTAAPNVVVSLARLDVDHGRNVRIQAFVENVTRDGCTIGAYAWADTIIYSVHVSWIAIGY